VPSSRLSVLAALAALVLALAGCGASDSQQVRDTVHRFADASAHHDYKTLCTKVFAPSLLARLNAVNLPCEQALARYLSALREPKLEIVRVSVKGSRAQVRVRTTARGQPRSSDRLDLVKTKAGWRIDARSG
jgi:hypothetical protein